MANEKTKLSPAQAAANAALVAQYIAPARIIARKSTAIEAAKGDTWSAFKDAAGIGKAAQQDVATMAKGISLACASVNVPQGTVNAYLPILRKLYADLLVADEAGQAALLSLSIKDARAKYQPPKTKTATTPASASAGATMNAADATDGTAGDADGVMGGTERSRMLSRINELLSTLSDADLSSFLAMLEPATSEPEADAAANG